MLFYENNKRKTWMATTKWQKYSEWFYLFLCLSFFFISFICFFFCSSKWFWNILLNVCLSTEVHFAATSLWKFIRFEQKMDWKNVCLHCLIWKTIYLCWCWRRYRLQQNPLMKSNNFFFFSALLVFFVIDILRRFYEVIQIPNVEIAIQ